MTSEDTTFWGRARRAAAERLGQSAAFLISLTAAIAALSMVGRAPEFSAILFGAGLIALAIYKRPPTTIQQHFRVEAMTLNEPRLGLEAGLALHVLDRVRDAASEIANGKGDAA